MEHYVSMGSPITGEDRSEFTTLFFPIGYPIVLLASFSLWTLVIEPIFRLRRWSTGRCPECAYDLQQLEGARCPECGADTNAYPNGWIHIQLCRIVWWSVIGACFGLVAALGALCLDYSLGFAERPLLSCGVAVWGFPASCLLVGMGLGWRIVMNAFLYSMLFGLVAMAVLLQSTLAAQRSAGRCGLLVSVRRTTGGRWGGN